MKRELNDQVPAVLALWRVHGVEAVGGQQVQPGNSADERARQDPSSQANQGTYRLGADLVGHTLIIFILSWYISYGIKLLMQKNVLIKTSVNFLCRRFWGFDSKQDPDQPYNFFSSIPYTVHEKLFRIRITLSKICLRRTMLRPVLWIRKYFFHILNYGSGPIWTFLGLFKKKLSTPYGSNHHCISAKIFFLNIFRPW